MEEVCIDPMGMYLISHRLFARKILDIYAGLKNPNYNFWLVYLDEVLGYYICSFAFIWGKV